MKERIVDSEITLVPYYPDYEETIEWYQDLELVKQVDNRDEPYDMELLKAMYTYLSTHGECYYIKYNGKLVGDVTLRDNCEVCIVVSKDYQNRHIGRRCIEEMIKLGKEKKLDALRAEIYSFNTQSQRMFLSTGFEKIQEEMYEYKL